MTRYVYTSRGKHGREVFHMRRSCVKLKPDPSPKVHTLEVAREFIGLRGCHYCAKAENVVHHLMNVAKKRRDGIVSQD